MNTAGKPKPVKLWKNSAKREKKSQLKTMKKELSGDPENISNESSEKNESITSKSSNQMSKKRKHKQKNSSPNKKLKSGSNSDVLEDNAMEVNDTQSKQSTQDAGQDNTYVKKKKPENMSRKEWKMLHMDKKLKDVVHADAYMKKDGWKELHKKQKGKTDIFELGKVLKNLWEELRRKDCKPERKNQLLKQVCDHIKGRVKEFSYAHDTVRILESVLALGAESHRTLLFEELKGEILPLTKSKYGKFFVLKLLKYGSKNQKDEIIKSFYGKVIKLMRHSVAASVVEVAFNECANAQQRFELIQEFFGPSYKFFKVSDVHSLEQLFEANPDKKSTIITNIKDELLKVLEKSVIKHSIVHHVLWQFMKHADASSKSDIIESLRDAVPEILHTKDGSRVGMHCIWYGSVKDRKAIVKSMKRFVNKIAIEEYGHMVLLAIFDAVDDTLHVEKNIISELKKNLLELSQNVHGKKVLVYLLSPRDPHFFHPDVINILKTGDDNETSKKNPEVRRSELKSIIAGPLLDLIKLNIQELYTNNAFCLFTVTILEHAAGDRKEAFEAVADLLVEPYTTENKNTHPVEHIGSSFMFKQLITLDQETPDAHCIFSEVLISKVPQCVMASWIECNRGAFLLIHLIETEIPSVIKRIKEELEGRKKYLAKKKFKGAEILLKKLKDFCK